MPIQGEMRWVRSGPNLATRDDDGPDILRVDNCSEVDMAANFYILRVANKNVTSLSSTHCSAPSAWPFRGNIIGFSKFWRKLVIFRTWNIYEIERSFIKEYLRFWTIIFWHLIHRLVLFFCHFLCFRRFNRCYLWFFKLFLLFYFSDILHGHLHIQRGLNHTFTGFLLARFQQTVMCLSGRHLTISSFHGQ